MVAGNKGRVRPEYSPPPPPRFFDKIKIEEKEDIYEILIPKIEIAFKCGFVCVSNLG
jgi:hypothetical protein